MGIHTTAGTVLKVSADAPATFDAAGYGALAFTTVGEITDHGEHGREYGVVTHQPVDTRGDRKFKGGFNEGVKTLQLALDQQDAGQVICKTAVDSDDPISVEVTYPDGDKDFFQVLVMSFKKNVGSRDQMTGATITFEVTTAADGTGIVEVDAA